jgi:addiction module RelE/StbE family toxin
VRTSGVHGLRAMKGMHDEALSGEWKGFRSSRLSGQWRVIYRSEASEFVVYVVRVTARDYRR